MLDFIRQYRALFSIVFVLSAVGLVVSMFAAPGGSAGMGSSLQSGVVARVDGREIQSRELLLVLNEELERAQRLVDQQSKGSPNAAEMRKFLEQLVRAQITPDNLLDGLVRNRVLLNSAEDMGVIAPPAFIRDVISKNPEFQENGRFSALLYKTKVPQPAEYEQRLAERIEALLFNRTFEFGLAVRSPLEEKQEAFLKQARDFEVLLVQPTSFSEPQSVSSAEVSEWMKSDEAQAVMRSYMDRNASRYNTPEQLQARHILVKNSPEAEKKIREIRADIAGGKLKFEDAAKKFSEDASNASKGGDLGWFARGVMDPAFEKAAFALQKDGELSEPVLSSFGWHLVERTGKREAESKTLETMNDEERRVVAGAALLEDLKAKNARKFVDAAVASGRAPSETELKQHKLQWVKAPGWTPLSAQLSSVPVQGHEAALLGLSKAGQLVPTVLTSGSQLALVRFVGLSKKSEAEAKLGPSAQELAGSKGLELFEFYLGARLEDLQKRERIVKSAKILQELRTAVDAARGGG